MTNHILKHVNEHLQYLKHLNKMLKNNDCIDQHYFKTSTECSLGCWLYGDGSIEIDKLNNPQIESLFRSLFEPHTQFHNISKEIIEQVGDKKQIQSMIIEMKEISNILTKKMLELDNMLKQDSII